MEAREVKQRLPLNEHGRDFIIGDIHGCYDTLMNAMERASFNKEVDRLISVGDLIDRGPDSLKCLKLIYEPWFFPVRGNHEDMMINAFDDKSDKKGDLNLWLLNGGAWIYRQDELFGDELQQLIAQLKSLPLAIQIGDSIGVVHAEPPSNWDTLDKPLNESMVEHLLWSRNRISRGITDRCEGIDYVFSGHTIVEQEVVLGNVIYVDLGAFKSSYMELIDLHEFIAKLNQDEVEPVPALDLR
jgi:serine/threonine protein phosphatase 1